MPKDLEKSLNYHRKDFSRSCQLSQKITLTLMTWKRPNLTQRIASVPVWQGPSSRPSLVDQRRGCSPEETRIIPREWYVSYFVFKTSKKIWEESGEFCSYRIGSYLRLFTFQKWSVYAGYKLFTPHWKPMATIDLRIYLYRIRNYSSQLIVPRIEFVLDPSCCQTMPVKFICTNTNMGRTQVTDWFRKIKVMGLNISEGVSNSQGWALRSFPFRTSLSFPLF